MTQTVVGKDGQAILFVGALDRAYASEMFSLLRHDLAWGTETFRLYGREITVPRRVCWYGNADARYRYSAVDHEPRPWTPVLSALRAIAEAYSGCGFNSVLGNLYRDHQDAMGWHRDNEPELGPQPTIASLSLGASRLFQLRHRDTRERVSIELESGSLLIMRGALQTHWEHRLPRTKRACGERINLTFRSIIPLLGSRPSRRTPA